MLKGNWIKEVVSLTFKLIVMTFLFLGNLGGWEMVAVVFVVLLLFGGKKIPELMRGLGAGIREFNNAKNSITNEIREGMREAERKNIPDNNNTNQ